MTRGRGYTRGGNRGGSSSYRGSGSNYRPSSGRNNNFSSSSYNQSRNNYNSSYNSDSRNRDRVSSSRHSDRHEDHKRSYRVASRDRSPDRKRSRHDDSRLSSSYSSYRRNESSRSRQTPPPPTVRPTSSSSSSYRTRRDDSHRHGTSGNDSMGPPKSGPPRSRTTRPRGGGGSSRLRGSPRGGIRIVRRRESSDMRIMRKQLLMARQRDRARRIKIAKLTSSLRKRKEVPRKTVRKPRSEKKDSDDGKQDDEEKKKSKDESGDNEEEKDITGKSDETENKESGGTPTAAKKPIADEDGKGTSTAMNTSTNDQGSDNADNEAVGDPEEKDEDDNKSSKRSPSKSRKNKKGFIKLTCVHCRTKCLTFKEYSNHLYSRTHSLSMRRLALRQKAQLSHLRMAQRSAQRDIEEKSKDELDDCKPQFCLLCRLNYRQAKSKHQVSEFHHSMKKLLRPYCSVCHIAFKNPMVYESHRCSLEHIKRKARNESINSDQSDNEKEVDLNNFLTVDSVGEIDAHGHQLMDEDDDDEAQKTGDSEQVNVGAEHVKKTEALYCDLCRFYFAPKEDEEGAIKKHCSTRLHLKAYLCYKDDQTLRLEAERLQRRQKETKDNKKKDEEKAEKDKDKEASEEPENQVSEDEDLGDLIRHNAREDDNQEDDEDDGSVLNINIERSDRFDRFKNSEKQEMNGNAKDSENEKNDEKDNDKATPTAATPAATNPASAKKPLIDLKIVKDEKIDK